MQRFVQGEARTQMSLLPECLDDCSPKTTRFELLKIYVYGYLNKADFHYLAEDDEYQCPPGERLKRRTNPHDAGKPVARYWTLNCGTCALKTKCTSGNEGRVTRWERSPSHAGLRQAKPR